MWEITQVLILFSKNIEGGVRKGKVAWLFIIKWQWVRFLLLSAGINLKNNFRTCVVNILIIHTLTPPNLKSLTSEISSEISFHKYLHNQPEQFV